MGQSIHPTAIVHDGAELGEDVSIGAFSIIGPEVKLGNNCVVHSHVNLTGKVHAGVNNKFFSFSSIGEIPQDLTYDNEPSVVEIGDNNIFREYVSIHRGTAKQDLLTKVGSNNLFMAYVHLGHDVFVEDNVIIVNAVNVAGHVRICSKAIIGGGSNISQFVTVGKGAYLGGASAIDRDIPHYCTGYGNRVKLKGINIVGLRRMGHSKQEVSEVVDFFRSMESSALSPKAYVNHKELMEEYKGDIITEMSEFIDKSEIGIAPFAFS